MQKSVLAEYDGRRLQAGLAAELSQRRFRLRSAEYFAVFPARDPYIATRAQAAFGGVARPFLRTLFPGDPQVASEVHSERRVILQLWRGRDRNLRAPHAALHTAQED